MSSPVPTFTPNGTVTYDLCPTCHENARIEHGKGPAGDPRHAEHCPNCGSNIVHVLYDCPYCSTIRYKVVVLHNYDPRRLNQIGTLLHVAPSTLKPDNDGMRLRFDDGREIVFSRYQLEKVK